MGLLCRWDSWEGWRGGRGCPRVQLGAWPQAHPAVQPSGVSGLAEMLCPQECSQDG